VEEVQAEVRDEVYSAKVIGDRIISITNDNTGVNLEMPAERSAQPAALAEGMKLAGKIKHAQDIINAINRERRKKPLPGNMLLSFARRTPDPEQFLTQRLHSGANPMDAVDHPVVKSIRDRIVNLGTDPETGQRETLSRFALVFIEMHREQFVGKTSGSVETTEYQYTGKPAAAMVHPLCVVEVGEVGADDGVIVRFVEVSKDLKKKGRGEEFVKKLMRDKGWPVK
jgi:hypothetical protein